MAYEDAQRLQQLEQEARELRKRVETEQSRCQHHFSDPVYEPYAVKEGYGYRLDREQSRGSDPVFGYEGYHDVRKSRWKRVCTLCGKVEYTEKTGEKTVSTGPDFGGK